MINVTEMSKFSVAPGADNTAAFKEALEKAWKEKKDWGQPGQKPVVIYIPAGIYHLSDTLDIDPEPVLEDKITAPGYLTLRGDGRGRSVLVFKFPPEDKDKDAISFRNRYLEHTFIDPSFKRYDRSIYLNGNHVEGLTISAESGRIALRLMAQSRFRITDCDIIGGKYGIYGNACMIGSVTGCRVESRDASALSSGVQGEPGELSNVSAAVYFSNTNTVINLRDLDVESASNGVGVGRNSQVRMLHCRLSNIMEHGIIFDAEWDHGDLHPNRNSGGTLTAVACSIEGCKGSAVYSERTEQPASSKKIFPDSLVLMDSSIAGPPASGPGRPPLFSFGWMWANIVGCRVENYEVLVKTMTREIPAGAQMESRVLVDVIGTDGTPSLYDDPREQIRIVDLRRYRHWSDPRPVPGVGTKVQGAGIALADIGPEAGPDLVVYHIANPGGPNQGHYRVGWNVHVGGEVSGGWGPSHPIPGGFGAKNQGGDIALADINGSGRPDLVVFHIEGPGAQSHGYYRVGWTLDAEGKVTGGWTKPLAVPGWCGAKDRGGGIALADISGDGHPDLVVFHLGAPAGQNHGHYQVGWSLDKQGQAQAWSPLMSVPGGYGAKDQGTAITLADTNRSGKLDLIVFHIENPPGENRGYYRIGRDLDSQGQVTGGWTDPVPIPGWWGPKHQGGGIAAWDLLGNGRPDLMFLQVDKFTGGSSQGHYRWAFDITSDGE